MKPPFAIWLFIIVFCIRPENSNAQNKKHILDFRQLSIDSPLIVSGDTIQYITRDWYQSRETPDPEFIYNFASFSTTIFDTTCNFSNIDFKCNVYFSESKFKYDMDFSGSKFLSEVNFDKSTIGSLMNFERAVMSDRLILTNLNLTQQSRFIFKGTVLPDTIDFSGTSKIFENIDLTVADYSNNKRYDSKADTAKPTMIFLYRTDVSKIHIDYVHYRLLLPDSVLMFRNLSYGIEPTSYYKYLGQKELITNDEKESIYDGLLNNFKQNGQQESYRLLDIEFKAFKWKHSWASWVAWLPRWWWNFGYSKELIFYHVLLFMIAFSLINYFFIYYLNTEVYPMNNIILDERWKKKISIKGFKNRLWYSIIYTSAIFFRLTLNIEKINYSSKIGTGYIFLIYTLGLICLAYMANFVLQK